MIDFSRQFRLYEWRENMRAREIAAGVIAGFALLATAVLVGGLVYLG